MKFTVYTVVNIPCYLEVTLEGNEVGKPDGKVPAVTVSSPDGQGNQRVAFNTMDGGPGFTQWWMTFFEEGNEHMINNAGSPLSAPGDNKWLYDCGQSLPPKWHITIKATDTWKLFILGGDLANQDSQKIRVQYQKSGDGGATWTAYGNMPGGGEATPSSDGNFGMSDTFATMQASWVGGGSGPTAGTTYWFKYRVPHQWTTPQGYYEGITGYLVASYE